MQEISFEKAWIKKILALYILRLLKEKSQLYGNQLIEEITSRSQEVIRPNPNSLYPLLRLLEERGYISGEWEHPDRKSKRLYQITDFGLSRISPLDEKVAIRLEELRRNIEVLQEDLLKKEG